MGERFSLYEVNNLQTFALLGWLAERGQSVSLSYGEDTGLWECSVVSSGKRFTRVSDDADRALRLVAHALCEAARTAGR